jgi:phospholipase/lecithinase/hemolysin
MRHLLSALLLITTQVCYSGTLHNIVIFGDSLSDNGNLYEYMHHSLPQCPPYFEGRFTNGPVWAERLVQGYFAHDSALHLHDYAFGGAGVLSEADDDDELFTLKREVDTYLLAHNNQIDPNNMYFVWIGGNNYLGSPDDIDAAVSDVIQGIQKDLERLVQKGAKNLTIMNLPDLGKTPLAKELEAVEKFTAISDAHNAQLFAMYERLRSMYPDARWFYFDANQIFTDIFQHPETYGFNKLTETCYDSLVQPSSPQSVLKMAANVHVKQNDAQATDNCKGYVFFDLLHPTQQVHQLTAEYIRRLFDQENISFVPR